MRATTAIGAVFIGALFALPIFAVAEEGSASAGVQVTESDVITAREAATGKATGRLNGLPPGMPVAEKHMMATGTKAVNTPRVEETRKHMMEKRSEILKRFAGLMIKRMHAAIDRLTNIADRLDARIIKEKSRGVDTSKAEANLALARTKLVDAKTAVSAAEAAVAGAIVSSDASASSTKPVDAGKPVREALNKAKDAVFAAHKALVTAIASLKGTREMSGKATTTRGATTTQ